MNTPGCRRQTPQITGHRRLKNGSRMVADKDPGLCRINQVIAGHPHTVQHVRRLGAPEEMGRRHVSAVNQAVSDHNGFN